MSMPAGCLAPKKTVSNERELTSPCSLQDHNTSNAKDCVQAMQVVLGKEMEDDDDIFRKQSQSHTRAGGKISRCVQAARVETTQGAPLGHQRRSN